MGILVNINDYGQQPYQFQVNASNRDSIEDFIDVSEKLWIKTILGETLGDEFINDPLEARWNKIKEPFVIHDRHCYGLKSCLVAFIYTDLIKRDGVYSAQGATKVKSEVNQGVDIQMNFAQAYNDGVNQARMIRHKLHIHKDVEFINLRMCEHREFLLTRTF